MNVGRQRRAPPCTAYATPRRGWRQDRSQPGITIVAPWLVQPKVGHRHPEAVVDGHRDAEPVLLGEAEQLSHQVAVVEES